MHAPDDRFSALRCHNGGIHEAGAEAEQKRYEVAQDHASMGFHSPVEAIESRGLQLRLRHMKRASRCAQGKA